MAELDIPEEGKEGLIKAQEVPKIKPPTRLRVGVIGTLAVIILIIFGLICFGLIATNQIQKTRTNKTKNEITQIDNELLNLKDVNEQAESLYGQVNKLSEILNQKAYWTLFFNEFSKRSTKDINVNDFEVSNDGTIKISGKAKSYESVAKFLVSLEDSEYFSSVILGQTEKESNKIISYNINLIFSPTILTKTEPETTQ